MRIVHLTGSSDVAGAEQLTLDGVYHSPLGGGAGRPWYGSPDIIDQWIRVVYEKELDTRVSGGGWRHGDTPEVNSLRQ